MSKFLKVEEEKCELEGPYECPHCGGHLMVDATFFRTSFRNNYLPLL